MELLRKLHGIFLIWRKSNKCSKKFWFSSSLLMLHNEGSILMIIILAVEKLLLGTLYYLRINLVIAKHVRKYLYREKLIMYFYHVISDRPKTLHQHFIVDEVHPNGVYDRVREQMSRVEDVLNNPEKYDGVELDHSLSVAIRELALEKVRKEKYPNYPSRMASLYVTRTYEEAVRWADYFVNLGRPTYCVAKIETDDRVFYGDAYKCFDGTNSEAENMRLAEIYWKNESNEDGKDPIVEVLVDGDIEIVEIMKEYSANL